MGGGWPWCDQYDGMVVIDLGTFSGRRILQNEFWVAGFEWPSRLLEFGLTPTCHISN